MMTNEERFELRVAAKEAANISRVYRNEQQRLYRKARKAKARRKNSDHLTKAADMLSSDRETIRKSSRLLHLARAYLFGRCYSEVEQSVRPGNEVNLEDLAFAVATTRIYRDDYVTVEDWLNT